MASYPVPSEFDVVREKARRALGLVKPATSATMSTSDFWVKAGRTNGGRSLPAPYLVHFLLIELLGFPHAGREEKVAWSIPIDFHGRLFTIEHRKFGLGIFIPNPEAEDVSSREICLRITKAIKASQSFFDWMADRAVSQSMLSVRNNSRRLFNSLEFFLKLYESKASEEDLRKDEKIVTHGKTDSGMSWTNTRFPVYELRREAQWLALAAIEAFFAWTEHILVHLAIAQGSLTTGQAVTSRAEADWATKFKGAFALSDVRSKQFYDRLAQLRFELRNYVAHGAFGKEGEAFSFHSSAGAVPVLLPSKSKRRSFRFMSGVEFDHRASIDLVQEFLSFVWDDARAPARILIQDCGLDLILPYAADGTYGRAMKSVEEMTQFVDYLNEEADRAANMDW